MPSNLKQDLEKLADLEKAKILARFFKTGEGDIFLGVKVPDQRKVAAKYKGLALEDLQKLLDNNIHECRLTALFILVAKYKKADDLEKKEIVEFYIKNTRSINNWDLVDSSAPYILGNYLLDKDKSILYTLAKSASLWERRIAMLSTHAFIRNNEFEDTLKIAEILLDDKHDLIHKAVGWMLREVGNRDLKAEECFLQKHCKNMPRTMLRYAIEKFENEKRNAYLKK